jgi:hypothetical protein
MKIRMREKQEEGHCGGIISKMRKGKRGRRRIKDIKSGRIVRGRENEEEITRRHGRKVG